MITGDSRYHFYKDKCNTSTFEEQYAIEFQRLYIAVVGSFEGQFAIQNLFDERLRELIHDSKMSRRLQKCNAP